VGGTIKHITNGANPNSGIKKSFFEIPQTNNHSDARFNYCDIARRSRPRARRVIRALYATSKVCIEDAMKEDAMKLDLAGGLRSGPAARQKRTPPVGGVWVRD
jgi:hypothetical protein